MPYILVEYSGNLLGEIAIRPLLQHVHAAAIASDVFDTPAIRTRAVRSDDVIMGDGNSDNGFVLITVRIRKGRDEAARRNLGERVLEAAARRLAPAFNGRSMALNVEIQEIEGLMFRRHHLRQ